MGKVHPDIIDARKQFSYEEPYLDLLRRRAPKGRRAELRVFLEIVFWLLIFMMVTGVLTPSNAWSITVTLILIVLRAGKAYFYDLPRKFHKDLESGLMVLVFCAEVETRQITRDLNRASFGFTVGNSIWVIPICIISGVQIAGYFDMGDAFIFMPSLFFLIWIIFVEFGIFSAMLPSWVYKSGLMFGVAIVLISSALALSWWITWLSWLYSWNNYHETVPSNEMALILGNVFLGVIAWIGWKVIPSVAEMRRRGVFG